MIRYIALGALLAISLVGNAAWARPLYAGPFLVPDDGRLRCLVWNLDSKKAATGTVVIRAGIPSSLTNVDIGPGEFVDVASTNATGAELEMICIFDLKGGKALRMAACVTPVGADGCTTTVMATGK